MTQQDGRAGRGINPEATQAAAGGYGVAIRRVGPAVEITLTSGSEYDSIELYDNLVQSIEQGHLRLELSLPRRTPG